MRLFEADCHRDFTRLYLASGEPAAARTSLDKARTIIETTGYHRRDDELETLAAELKTLTAQSV